MDFQDLRNLQRTHVRDMLHGNPTMFTVDVDKEVLWNRYLDSFPAGTNEIFRQRREFDCSCCRSFIKNLGNVVIVRGTKLVSIWGFQTNDPTFQPVMDALNDMVTSARINGVFVSKEKAFGTDVSRELRDGDVTSWRHFHITMPPALVYAGSKTVETIMGDHRTNREVFESSLSQISIDAVETVLDLISQNSLYRGEEWVGVLQKFLALKREWARTWEDERNNWCWVKSVEVGPVVGRIKNHSIGTLLLDLSQGVGLDEALRKYEAVVAPSNYKRPQAVFTARMVEQAKKTVIELGLENSLGRRFACLDDITINNVLFADRSVTPRLGGDVFEKLGKQAPLNPRAFDRVEEVPLQKFLGDVLPRATSLEVLVENKHLPNLVSLIAPLDREAPTMFKWGNNFSWAYSGNMTDSMKERVKAAGGKVDGVLRFSIQWNDEKGSNLDDLDAHCIEPNGDHIYFGRKRILFPSTGMLDVDIIHPQGVAVENITYINRNKMREGIYHFYVHCYSHRGGQGGFRAEIEFDGQVYEFEYGKNMRDDKKVTVAKVRFNRQTGFEIVESLPSTLTPRTAWGLTTQQFVPVLGVMYSPNYWDERGIGNRHVIFALKGCVNDTQPNGFFNEYLKEDLLVHKRVFEALGREMKVEPSEDQLSGLGFATTQRNELVVKVTGATARTIKIVF